MDIICIRRNAIKITGFDGFYHMSSKPDSFYSQSLTAEEKTKNTTVKSTTFSSLAAIDAVFAPDIQGVMPISRLLFCLL